MSLKDITNDEILFIIGTFQRFVANCKKECDCDKGCRHCYAYHFLNGGLDKHMGIE